MRHSNEYDLPSWKIAFVVSGVLVLLGLLLVMLLSNPVAQPQALQAEEGQGQEKVEVLGQTAIDNRYVLVIDPGHGGDDPGALDQSGEIYEADITQAVAEKLAEKLGHRAQEIRVEITHQAGETMSSMERANFAQAEYADLMISLHLNSDINKNLRGFQCFPLPPGRLQYDKSYEFASLLVQNVRATEHPVMGASGIYYTYYVQQPDGNYKKEIYDSHWFDHSQPRREETFGVLEYSGCPAVLVEQWYISNSEDMALYYSEDGMEQMADLLYRTVCEYFELPAD